MSISCRVSRALLASRFFIQRAAYVSTSSAVLQKKQAGGRVNDPIQQLFLDKIREYRQKSQQAPGELFDVPVYTANSLRNELEAVERRYNPDKEDFTKLPTLSFKEPNVEAPGLGVQAPHVVGTPQTTPKKTEATAAKGSAH